MYLGNDSSERCTDLDGTQRHTQGNFLLLCTPDDKISCDKGDIRACVRQVALEQMGHFMMGTARIGGEKIAVSGTYGNMGLTVDLPRDVWEKYCTEIPGELYDAWANGGGHNTAGDEAGAMRQWALDNYDALTPA